MREHREEVVLRAIGSLCFGFPARELGRRFRALDHQSDLDADGLEHGLQFVVAACGYAREELHDGKDALPQNDGKGEAAAKAGFCRCWGAWKISVGGDIFDPRDVSTLPGAPRQPGASLEFHASTRVEKIGGTLRNAGYGPRIGAMREATFLVGVPKGADLHAKLFA